MVQEHYHGQGPADQVKDVLGKKVLDLVRLGAADDAISEQAQRVRDYAGTLLFSDDPWDAAKAKCINNVFGRTDREVPKEFTDTGNIYRNLLAWVVGADDATLVDFLKWNEQSLREPQRQLRHRARHMEAFILRDVRRMSRFLLPKNTPELFEATMDNPDYLHLQDAFGDGHGLAIAEYDDDTKRTWVSEGRIQDEELYMDLLHEFFHGASNLANGTLVELFGTDDTELDTTLDKRSSH